MVKILYQKEKSAARVRMPDNHKLMIEEHSFQCPDKVAFSFAAVKKDIFPFSA